MFRFISIRSPGWVVPLALALFMGRSANADIVTKFSFNGAKGSNPTAGVVMDGQGNLYGTTSYGGDYGYGTIFKYSESEGLQTLYSFNQSSGGYQPLGALTLDAAGNLYGTTRYSSAGSGSIFEFTPGSENAPGAMRTLYEFKHGAAPSDGVEPWGSLTFGPDGKLYGTTTAGGDSNWGTLFRLDLTTPSPTLTTLVQFTGSSGDYLGGDPNANVVFDAQGNLYGTTSGGGTSGNGTLFEVDKDGAFHSLASFSSTGTGKNPVGGLTIDSQGNLYGTASAGWTEPGPGGVTHSGTLFRYNADTGLTALVKFDGTNGASPRAGLIADSNGVLYGTTIGGGDNNRGTVFQYDPTNDSLKTLASFDPTNSDGMTNNTGTTPSSTLVMNTQGLVYGTTTFGGQYGDGTVFALQTSGTLTGTPEPGALAMLGVAGVGAALAYARRVWSARS